MAKWEQFAARIETDITTGALKPGQQLASETTYMHQTGYSRDTIRRALSGLAARGLITTAQGQLRHVAQRVLLEVHVTRTADRVAGTQAPTAGADSWLADMATSGHQPGESLAVRHVPAGRFAGRLQVDAEWPVIAREMVRSADGKPHNVAVWVFPAGLAAGTPLALPENVNGGSVPWLEHAHGPLRYRVEIETRMPTPAEAQVLAIPPGVSLAAEYRTGISPTGPVFVSETLWPGDRARLILDL